jgi:hypothetical protein
MAHRVTLAPADRHPGGASALLARHAIVLGAAATARWRNPLYDDSD